MKWINEQTRRLLQTLRAYWIKWFWTRPDNLWALKVSVSITLLVIPCVLLGQPFIATTLALGAVGAALAESDDHPRGRRKTLFVTILSFLIVSTFVELLRPYPYLFGFGLAATTFLLILLGGISHRYQGVTFGALLVSIYAMLGTGIKPWYYQPILLPLGGLMYGSISLLLLYARPYRLLKEQLATAYSHLAGYMTLKASLFPSTAPQQKRVRTALAQMNIAIGRSIDSTKQVIYACAQSLEGRSFDGLVPYYNKWILLQQLHERAASSHERYDLLSKYCADPLLIEGFGKLMDEIGGAMKHLADTILTGSAFTLPTSLKWTEAVLAKQLERSTTDPQYPALSLLFHNLSRVIALMAQVDDDEEHVPISSLNYQPAPLIQRIRALFDVSQARFRHAVRLTVCFVVGYVLITLLDLEKGDWVILTSLFVCQQSYTATRQRLSQRIVGTFVGIALGVTLAHLLPTQAGQIVLLITAIFAFFYWLRKRYAYAVIFITIFVIAAFNLQTGTGVAVMGPRLLDTLIGAFLAFFVVRFFWPDWQYKHLPQLMHTAIEKNLRYFDTIYNSDVRGEAYYHNRRTAHQADNALTTAWKGMFVEPKSKRKLQKKAFALTYLNHSLLSYISALGAHHYNTPLSAEDKAICARISLVLQQVQSVLSPAAPKPLRPVTLTEARRWELELYRLRQASDDRLLVLLYNTMHVAIDLLKEAQHAR